MGAVVIAVVFALVYLIRPKTTTVAPAAALKRVTSDSGLTMSPAISPDGRLVAYASDRAGKGNLDVWVQQTSGGLPVQLTFDTADEHEPAFSLDSSTIAFRSERNGGGVYLIPALGGSPVLVGPEGQRPRFSPDGSSLAYWVGLRGGDVFTPGGSSVYVVPVGGVPHKVVTLDQPARAIDIFTPLREEYL